MPNTLLTQAEAHMDDHVVKGNTFDLYHADCKLIEAAQKDAHAARVAISQMRLKSLLDFRKKGWAGRCSAFTTCQDANAYSHILKEFPDKEQYWNSEAVIALETCHCPQSSKYCLDSQPQNILR